MTTADFAQYKALVVPDPKCGNLSAIDFLNNKKADWTPAITGNIILIGTDPSYHDLNRHREGAPRLMHDSIAFAAAGKGTGLYLSLSCYYDKENEATVESLSGFGEFKVRGRLQCYNDAHLVAGSDALATLNDGDVSNWGCSVHEVFSSYPTTGPNGFEPLAIARNAVGVGRKTFGDNSNGIPYILSRGATPFGCGNGVLDRQFEEECDDGENNGKPGSLCSISCKCLFGSVPGGGCTSNTTSSSSTSSSMESTPLPSATNSSETASGNSTSVPTTTALFTNST